MSISAICQAWSDHTKQTYHALRDIRVETDDIRSLLVGRLDKAINDEKYSNNNNFHGKEEVINKDRVDYKGFGEDADNIVKEGEYVESCKDVTTISIKIELDDENTDAGEENEVRITHKARLW